MYTLSHCLVAHQIVVSDTNLYSADNADATLIGIQFIQFGSNLTALFTNHFVITGCRNWEDFAKWGLRRPARFSLSNCSVTCVTGKQID